MIGENISAKRGNAGASATAGGSGDNTAVTGVIIDLAALNFPQDVAILIPFTTTLAAGKKLFFKSASVQHDDASNLGSAAAFATLEDSTGTAVATSSGGGTVTDCKKYNVHLGGAKRYVRFDFTPDLDATGTDTATIGQAVLVFGDAPILPAV